MTHPRTVLTVIDLRLTQTPAYRFLHGALTEEALTALGKLNPRNLPFLVAALPETGPSKFAHVTQKQLTRALIEFYTALLEEAAVAGEHQALSPRFGVAPELEGELMEALMTAHRMVLEEKRRELH